VPYQKKQILETFSLDKKPSINDNDTDTEKNLLIPGEEKYKILLLLFLFRTFSTNIIF